MREALEGLRDLPPLGAQIPPFLHRARFIRPIARLIARPILFLLKFLTTHQATVNANLQRVAECHSDAIHLTRQRLDEVQAAGDRLTARFEERVEHRHGEFEARADNLEARLGSIQEHTHDVSEIRDNINTHSNILDGVTRHLETLRGDVAASRVVTEERTREVDRLLAEVLNAVTSRDARIRELREVAAELRERTDTVTAELREWIDTASEEARSETKVALAELRSHLADLDGRTEAALTEVRESTESIPEEVQERTDGALGELRSRLGEIGAEVQSRAGALEAELEKRTRRIDERIDFVRRETLFEVRYGKGPDLSPPTGERRLRIAELPSAGDNREPSDPDGGEGPIRLNVGCGAVPLEDYVNVDRRDLPSVDLLAEANDLPFELDSVEEIYSAHLLEHFPQEQLRRDVLPYWRSLLRPGGTLRAVVPDAEAMLQEYADGGLALEDLREVTFGAQDYDGDFHYNMFTPDSLAELLREAGFVDVRCLAKGRRNGKCLEFEVSATNPDEGGARAGASSSRAASPRSG